MAQHLAGGDPVLEVTGLQKAYGSRDNLTRALDGVSLVVERGEFTAIMGPSGSGKSTLLNCIATIDSPTAGSVRVDGIDVSSVSRARLADFRREHLGFVFQDANLIDTLTGRENVALPLTIARTPADVTAARVETVTRELGVAGVLEKYPYQMSGGERQRVAAARALVTNPSLVLADEPTGALDTHNARMLLECLERANREHGATILMVTHDETAASFCRRAVFIRDGRLFTELRRGDVSRREFFDQIVQVVAVEGGAGDAR